MSDYTYAVWAIDVGFSIPGAHPFAGPYLLSRYGQVKPWQRGIPIAFFRTRKEAREELRRVKKTCPLARIVRLGVHVQRLGGKQS